MLSLAEREEISRGISAGRPAAQIAAQIGRVTSTVCREIARNGGRDSYRANVADSHAWTRARRPKACKLATVRRLRRKSLRGVWGSGPSDVWAVGESGTILHYDGVKVTPHPSTKTGAGTTAMWAVWGAAADDVYVVGNSGTILRYH